MIDREMVDQLIKEIEIRRCQGPAYASQANRVIKALGGSIEVEAHEANEILTVVYMIVLLARHVDNMGGGA